MLFEAKFLPHFHRKLSQKLLTDFRDGCIMYDNKSQRRSSHVYEQVLLLLLCHGLPDFCEIREVRSGFRNNKNTDSPHSSCRWGHNRIADFYFFIDKPRPNRQREGEKSCLQTSSFITFIITVRAAR